MGNYVTLADIQAEGIPESTPPGRIERRITKWEEIVERVTGNVFRVLSPGELTFYGDGTRTLFFNTPIISVTSLKINGEDTALPTTEYRVYNGRQKPRDDRHNPRIQLVGKAGYNIFTGSTGVFREDAEQKITATWGYVTENNETPAAIKDAIIELVIRDLDSYQDKQEDGGKPLTHVIRRRVDQSHVEFERGEEVRLLWGMIPRDIADVLALYRAPWHMA